ncbi:oxidoreductase [Larkinella insperata]|uniref:Oxidoreductase n=1 Tax=Larkinella insperata TaxID=332158 RepID=A0ABW3QMW4_9BACT|nr:oxidoreductase [Larkinella insperata]
MNTQNVWFVTGASKGLGLSLVKQLLTGGQRVAATSRSLDDLVRAVGTHDHFLPLAVDLKTESSVAQAIAQTITAFGRIDVVVNNAGFGLVGSLEELSDAESRENFEVNVFGSLNVIRNVMPHLRAQQSGHIFNISSIGGFTGAFPGFGIYCATKFAVVGFSESLAEEVKSFGVHVTVVEPGYFRTDFLTSGSLNVPGNQIEAYQAVRDSQQTHQSQINGNQPGDPEKAVAALIRIASESNPPLHLFLGQDAYDMAHEKIKAVQRDLETWKAVTVSTGFETANA